MILHSIIRYRETRLKRKKKLKDMVEICHRQSEADFTDVTTSHKHFDARKTSVTLRKTCVCFSRCCQRKSGQPKTHSKSRLFA